MVNVKDPFLVPGSNDPIDIAHWVNRICTHRSEIEKQNLIDACNLAYEIHENQTRVSGDPYLAHVLTVADILADLGMDTDVLIAGILHEACDQNSLKRIQKRFGAPVRHLIEDTSKMHAIEEVSQDAFEQHWEDKQKERFRKMLLAMAEDVRVVLIKLADRLDKMRTLRYEEESAQHRIAQETLDLYAPLANRLGIWQIKWELEDLSLRYLEPTAYKKLAKLLDERRVDREDYIQGIMSDLTAALAEEGIEAEISGRPKHIYSIWNKMNRKQTNFDRIFDVLAVRVLVQSVTQCYTVLGIVHRKWQPIPHEFDDYIASPKHNNYQSLHTAVYGPENKVFEVQIRTQDMHRHAELGVAAHWRYKEGGNSAEDQRFNAKIAWLRQILQTRDDDTDSDDLIDRFKSEIYEDRVYVLSPKGKVVDLPKGATPLDFAYHIHTQLGHRCRGAKVSGRIVSLNYELQSGEQVEILTSNESRPSRDWLNPNLHYLQTSRARSKVRHWLTKQNSQQHIADGRHLLEKELARLNIHDISLDKLAQRMRFTSVDAFLAALGRGDLTVLQVARILQDLYFPAPDKIKPIVVREPSNQEHSSIQIRGVGGLLTQTAGCCKPIPYDPIIGYVTKMRGVVIHRQDCPNALRWQDEDNERLIEVEWGMSETEDSQLYPLDVQILAYDRKGLLHDVCQIAFNEKINILATNTLTNKKDDTVKMQFTVEVTGLDQLSRALAKIDNLTNVMEVKRVQIK
ncbi:bifunctional (p)ppGpp synthetase/guanosine-3',5'-bis(diphosphate) 3'-pyrophosphohydrolase [Candidatus Albibeggiatoa sp. nov. NOAA]|uniref:RelA/SpoT family protein n=1 Tax=Candidatus Albibeggiatoa sp. nov. NOAA TaxID=3162724 RepID=UPI0032F2CEC4|nr:bifunctional (p)ppGpp synthetase/guanosine-3',5'-bis(diphosphate) 3'-pyrophosphohydrolase [Thiotrichaceae bacterium]